ncbi:MAG: hypothetical protein HYZ45_06320 [Burkholderiales bacterium]|nr:hypothetical protein [Burkholderiales bacterium]
MQLNPAFPIVEGHFPMPQQWALQLPARFNRRIENGDLVLWREGITAWIAVWNNDKNDSVAQRLQCIREKQPKQAQQVQQNEQAGVQFYSYCIEEEADEGDEDEEIELVQAMYGYAFAANSHVEMVIYCDEEEDVAQARAMFASLKNG